MHVHFADWYREISLLPKDEELKKRWQAIEKVVESIEDKNEIFELIKICFSMESKSSDYLNGFCTFFHDEDTTFKMYDNMAELRVLSGVCLIHSLEKLPVELANFMSLAINCVYFDGLLEEVNIIDVIKSAKNHIKNEFIGKSKFDQLKEIDQLDIGKDDPADPAKLKIILLTIAEKINNLINNMNIQSYILKLQQEETNLLWWLTAAHSQNLNIHYKEATFPGVCLIMGKELADLVLVLPGPFSAESFLDRILHEINSRAEEKVSIKDTVNSIRKEWGKDFINIRNLNDIIDFCPLHLALGKSLETESESDWLSFFTKKTKIDTNKLLKPVKIAYQMYQECLLIKSFESLK